MPTDSDHEGPQPQVRYEVTQSISLFIPTNKDLSPFLLSG